MAELTIDGITLKFKDSAFTGDQWESVASWVLNGGAASIEENAKLAQDKALAAIQAAAAAEASASSVDDIARQSESYAVGGTGTRVGEDTDNARYYCEQAHAIAGEDIVIGVNGIRADRYGNVNIDTGVMSINGVAPNANGNVDIDFGGVKTVNGIAPDASGNVNTGVRTINGSSPDANGNVVVTPSGIGAATMAEVNAAIDLAIIGAIEGAY